MTKTKKKTGNDMVMEFLQEDFLYEMLRKDIRIKKMMLKGGLGDWLLVVTARVNGNPVVLFVGSSNILGVARKLHEQFVNDKLVWKEDKYAD